MYACALCHFDCTLDDVVFALCDGSVICFRCYARLAETTTYLSKTLNREVVEILREHGSFLA